MEIRDYSSPGAYFVTVCVKDRKELLSGIVGTVSEPQKLDGLASGNPCSLPDDPQTSCTNELTKYGEITDKYINQMNGFYGHITVDKYVIMPDHIHFLLSVTPKENGPSGTPVPTNSAISQFIGTFKKFCNKEYGTNIWQARSFDHIIRNENDYWDTWNYIDTNVIRWQTDKLNESRDRPPGRSAKQDRR